MNAGVKIIVGDTNRDVKKSDGSFTFHPFMTFIVDIYDI